MKKEMVMKKKMGMTMRKKLAMKMRRMMKSRNCNLLSLFSHFRRPLICRNHYTLSSFLLLILPFMVNFMREQSLAEWVESLKGPFWTGVDRNPLIPAT